MNEMTKADAFNAQASRMAGRPSSEATMVEQQRAIAQVQGALIVAQQRPRDQILARERMSEACQVQSLADRAFYRYSRGGSPITGPSIHMATELARCWGNVDYGIVELRRDDAKGESEMLSYAWDLETNNRVTNSFIVPHKRDKRGGPEALTDMRDIYENNANAAARRLRECIFRVLPTSFLEEAKAVCQQTLEHGGGEPIEKRREKLLEAFNDLGVNRAQIEKKMARAADRLTAYDLGVLRVVYQSIKRGETTLGEEFDIDAGSEISAALNKTKEPPEPAPAKAEPAAQTEDAKDWTDDFKSALERAKTVKAVDGLVNTTYRNPLEDLAKADKAKWEVLMALVTATKTGMQNAA